MDTRIAEILSRLGVIEERTTTLNHEFGGIQKSVVASDKKLTQVCTDVSWLKRFFWVVAGASVSAAFMGFIILVKMFGGG